MLDRSSVARGFGLGVHSANEVAGDPTLFRNIAVTRSLNVPGLTVQSTANSGDNVAVSATTDDGDGATTSGVQLFNGASLLGSFTGGAGSWSFTMNGVTVGTYILVARRQTNLGTVDSAPRTLVVSAPAGVQGNVQVNTTGGNVQVDTTTGKIQVDL